MDIKENYQYWLKETKNDEAAQKDLLSIQNDTKKIEDRFFKELEFGTAGLRGKLGFGTNAMNHYIIERCTQGLANYLNNHYKNPSMVIGHDSRNFSREFALVTARVLAANGIKVFLFKELVPVPVISFTLKNLKCTGAIAITASHNPKEYNGYKVYADDGAQIGVEVADEIIKEMSKLNYFNSSKQISFEDGVKSGLIIEIFEDMFDKFIKSTMEEAIEPNEKKDIKIVYTPLNGAGYKFVTKALSLDGFNDVNIVEEQKDPNGNFPTAPYPNPETKEALALGIKKLEEIKGDILIATDPDSDRVGVACLDKTGVHILSGNEVGILLFDFIYQSQKEQNKLPESPVIVKSVVSSDLVNIMANKYGVEVKDVLTGFKFIGEQIKLLEKENAIDRFLLGFEESCGYLTNIDVRDKDGVNACLLVSEMANHYKKKGQSLFERINSIYDEFGHFMTNTVSYAFEGPEGKAKMDNIMSFFRNPNNDTIFKNISKKYDFKAKVGTYGLEGTKFDLPSSDVIKFWFKDNSSLTIRPSGTEPKIKFYYFIGETADNDLKSIVEKIVK